jgi:hypothetical protein
VCGAETWAHSTYNKKRKANGIGHVLHMNCLIKHVIEGNIERKLEGMG